LIVNINKFKNEVNVLTSGRSISYPLPVQGNGNDRRKCW